MITGGLDVGRFRDRTALVVLDSDVVTEAHLLPPTRLREQARILVPLISRLDLTAVDMTGLGVGLFELLAEAGLPVAGITLGAGMRPRVHGARVTVGKAYLVGRAIEAVHGRKITVAPWCCHRAELRTELEQLKAGHTKSGGLKLEAATGHDDLVVALGLAILARDLSSSRGHLAA